MERLAETRAPPMARGADRICDLPEDVLHHILSLLPARDAVRTCVLAQSWRNCWRSAPALRFACSTGWVGGVDAFECFVDSLLHVRRRGPPLDSCDFDLDVVDLEYCDYGLDFEGNSWIRLVLELRVRELRFRISGNTDNPFMLDKRPLSSQHLTSLELKGVQDIYGVLDFSECPALESQVGGVLDVEGNALPLLEESEYQILLL
jgi:hypothetical protein